MSKITQTFYFQMSLLLFNLIVIYTDRGSTRIFKFSTCIMNFFGLDNMDQAMQRAPSENYFMLRIA